MARTRRAASSPEHGVDLFADVVVRASRDANGVPVDLLEGYLEDLDEVSTTGRQPRADRLRLRHEVGARAAVQGVPLRGVIDLHLSATWLAWSKLSGVRQATGADGVRSVGEAVFKAADAAVMAVTEGYEKAQRWSVRQEEAFRREFVDDLLDGQRRGQRRAGGRPRQRDADEQHQTEREHQRHRPRPRRPSPPPAGAGVPTRLPGAPRANMPENGVPGKPPHRGSNAPSAEPRACDQSGRGSTLGSTPGVLGRVRRVWSTRGACRAASRMTIMVYVPAVRT